jgi:hypothetical protein
MTDQEIKWLDFYHETVKQELIGLVNSDAQQWLIDATSKSYKPLLILRILIIKNK